VVLAKVPQVGESRVSERESKVYKIDFVKRRLRQWKALPISGTAVNGYFSQEGKKIDVALCRPPGITHPMPKTDSAVIRAQQQQAPYPIRKRRGWGFGITT
jgi:hypothetical protein